jgi:hypothetical protein
MLMKIILLYIKFGHFLNLPQEGFGIEMNTILSIRPQVFFPKFLNRPMEFNDKCLQTKFAGWMASFRYNHRIRCRQTLK